MVKVIKVSEFVSMNKYGVVYKIVDIHSRGCKTDRREVKHEVYGWQAKELCGDARVVEFELVGKKTMILYCEF